MDISRTVKDVILITPWVISILCMFIIMIPVYLMLLLWANLIFIGKKTKGIYAKR